MSLFARNFYDEDMSFAPVFRFIDAFDNWNARTNSGTPGRSSVVRAAFNPKFDVVETKNSYELHGEIPGVDRKDISIEFTEPQTIVIHGRVERKYTSGTPPAGFIESQKSAGALTEGSGKDKEPAVESHRATVTDEATEVAKERGTPEGGQVAKANGHNKPAHHSKFWCQERSIGEFHRTFSFPVPVDENAVKANLDNGVLHVSVPKQEKRASRRVEIS